MVCDDSDDEIMTNEGRQLLEKAKKRSKGNAAYVNAALNTNEADNLIEKSRNDPSVLAERINNDDSSSSSVNSTIIKRVI